MPQNPPSVTRIKLCRFTAFEELILRPRIGVQIFIATHDYVILKQMRISFSRT